VNPPPEEVRSHRAPPGPLQRTGSRASVGTLLITALAVGGVLANWRQVDGARGKQRERPYVIAGSVGEPVSARAFDATVVSVRGGKLLGFRGKGYETGGVWILVRLRVTATEEKTQIGYAAVLDERDRTYLATGRMTQPFADSGRTFQPGVPIEGEIAFEVPRDAATTLRVRLASPITDRRMDAIAEIALPKVDAAAVDKWATDETPVILATPEVVA
jgi:hypothetical protein